MQRKLYKELWLLRFQKMLELEEGSVSEYEDLLKKCGEKYGSGLKFQDELKNLIADEKKHVRLVRELLSIVREQKD